MHQVVRAGGAVLLLLLLHLLGSQMCPERVVAPRERMLCDGGVVGGFEMLLSPPQAIVA